MYREIFCAINSFRSWSIFLVSFKIFCIGGAKTTFLTWFKNKKTSFQKKMGGLKEIWTYYFLGTHKMLRAHEKCLTVILMFCTWNIVDFGFSKTIHIEKNVWSIWDFIILSQYLHVRTLWKNGVNGHSSSPTLIRRFKRKGKFSPLK